MIRFKITLLCLQLHLHLLMQLMEISRLIASSVNFLLCFFRLPATQLWHATRAHLAKLWVVAEGLWGRLLP